MLEAMFSAGLAPRLYSEDLRPTEELRVGSRESSYAKEAERRWRYI
jgi:hypothetical protein